MSKEDSTIHEFDINLICEYFSLMERQGPGSPEVTIQALSFVDNLSDDSRIVDLGCTDIRGNSRRREVLQLAPDIRAPARRDRAEKIQPYRFSRRFKEFHVSPPRRAP